jgi:hypothetical protein
MKAALALGFVLVSTLTWAAQAGEIGGVECRVVSWRQDRGQVEGTRFVSAAQMDIRRDETSPIPTATATGRFDGTRWSWQMDLVSGEVSLTVINPMGDTATAVANGRLGSPITLASYDDYSGTYTVSCALADRPGRPSRAQEVAVAGSRLTCTTGRSTAQAQVSSATGIAQLDYAGSSISYDRKDKTLLLLADRELHQNFSVQAVVSAGMPVSLSGITCSVE